MTNPPVPYLQIRPSTGWANLKLREIWRYRELLIFMAWRDIIIRYKQTVIGAGWALVQPVLSMVVFSLIFGGLAGIPSDGIPYPIFNFAAMVPWTFFSGALTRASNSLINNGPLITKIFFPRIILPISTVLAGVIDFLIALAILIIMLWAYVLLGQPAPFASPFTAPFGIAPYAIIQIPFISLNWLVLPYLLLLAVMTTLGISFILSSMMVPYRDIRFIVPFLIQMWLYISPVVYPSSMIQNEWLRLVYSLNPMTGVIDGFRWALLGTIDMPISSMMMSTLIAVLLMLIGAIYFRQQERSFADVI
ncbi:MAG: ABC transporter permease [Anaerolineae bacterium]|nr:ABC transporter permease [Anaerolineae bacterium]